ncbi:MAG: hypothetical protein KDA96_27915, partial [Planctomycetaceae bacterium]|nr:hypothetical protein [Planctomycetaceae bacterium]
MIRDDPAVAELVLRSILQTLALPAEEQIELYADAPCVTCILADLYRKWSTTFAGSREAAAVTKRGHQVMERLASAVRITSYPVWSTAHPCGDQECLHRSEYFSTVRCAAREALCEYGWSMAHPSLEFLPGAAEHAARLDTVQAEREQRQNAKGRTKKARLKYHRLVFDELGIIPVVSQENVAILKGRERELGIAFPGAVFEWFSLEGVAALFRERTNQDELVNEEHDDWDKLNRLGHEELI